MTEKVVCGMLGRFMSDFHLREYIKLWSDYGVENLSLQRLRNSGFSKIRPTAVTGAVELTRTSFSSLEELKNHIGDCKRCNLCSGRRTIVFGSGSEKAKLFFVGEGPGADEDMEGEPFVGRAGKLLTKIIEAMGMKREDCYIANVVKCRPPQNRMPLPEEVEQCSPFLRSQIEIVKPNVIVALGLCATAHLLGTQSSMSNLRGRFHKLPWNQKVMVMPTYHPAYLLRNPGAKKMVWDDMKQVKQQFEVHQ